MHVSQSRPGLMTRLATMLALHGQRRQLRQMDDAQLRDLGLTRAEAERESRRPAWDVPAKWRA
nr:DUF1127 domain-containing protein [Oceaniglobus trochenteri]